MLLAVAAANAHAVDNVALLGLVSEATGFVRPRWARRAVNNVELAVFPAAEAIKHFAAQVALQNSPHAEEEAQYIRLLFLVELAHVLVCAHLEKAANVVSALLTSTQKV